MTSRRNFVAVLALAALLLLAFPLLGSLLADWFGGVPAGNPVAGLFAVPTDTPTATATATLTFTPTLTQTPTVTATPTLTPTPTATSTAVPTATPTPTTIPSPTPMPKVYLAPFVQVFAIGQPVPTNSTQVLMYQGGNDLFAVLGVQGGLTHLQTLDGAMNFWTASGNVSTTPPLPPQYDYSVRGKTATLNITSVYACNHSEQPNLAFGVCQTLTNVTSATLVARIGAGGTVLYLAQIGGVQYLIPVNVVSHIS